MKLTKKPLTKLINNMKKSEIIETYFPNYYNSDKIALLNDLAVKIENKTATINEYQEFLDVEEFCLEIAFLYYEKTKNISINEAKNVLQKAGYSVDNLFSISDVQNEFLCTPEEALNVLTNVFNNEYIVGKINEAIVDEGIVQNLDRLNSY